MRIAVFGAGGLLGSQICLQFGADAIPLIREDCDFLQAGSISNVVGRIRPDVVINAAAFTAVDGAETQQDLCRQVNAVAVAELARACNGLGALLVQISTDYVFGVPPVPPRPWKESDRPAPVGVYARSKREGELAAAECERHLIVRSCGLYGPAPEGRRPTSFVDKMLALGRSGRRVRVVDDQSCTPTSTVHLARAIRFLVESATASGIWHVTCRGETTWFDFAKALFEMSSTEVDLAPISTEQFGAAAPRPAYSVLDVSKYQASGGPPMPDWREALREYLMGTWP